MPARKTARFYLVQFLHLKTTLCQDRLGARIRKLEAETARVSCRTEGLEQGLDDEALADGTGRLEAGIKDRPLQNKTKPKTHKNEIKESLSVGAIFLLMLVVQARLGKFNDNQKVETNSSEKKREGSF